MSKSMGENTFIQILDGLDYQYSEDGNGVITVSGNGDLEFNDIGVVDSSVVFENGGDVSITADAEINNMIFRNDGAVILDGSFVTKNVRFDCRGYVIIKLARLGDDTAFNNTGALRIGQLVSIGLRVVFDCSEDVYVLDGIDNRKYACVKQQPGSGDYIFSGQFCFEGYGVAVHRCVVVSNGCYADGVSGFIAIDADGTWHHGSSPKAAADGALGLVE